jgi:ribosomal protein L11 methylase PrmA
VEGGRKYGAPSNYQEKYRKIFGGLDHPEKSAVKMEPNKAFGYGKGLHDDTSVCVTM